MKSTQFFFFILLIFFLIYPVAADNNPYENVSFTNLTPAVIDDSNFINLTAPDVNGHWDYVEVTGTRHDLHIGRLNFSTSPYVVTSEGNTINRIDGLSWITQAKLATGTYDSNSLTTSDGAGQVQLNYSYFNSLIKEDIVLARPVKEIGYDYADTLDDWTIKNINYSQQYIHSDNSINYFDGNKSTHLDYNDTFWNSLTNDEYASYFNNSAIRPYEIKFPYTSSTTLGKNSRIDVDLDNYGNCIVYINGGQELVLPTPSAVDAAGKKYNLAWDLDNVNKVLKIGHLDVLANATYPVTVDPTEEVTNWNFASGNLNGWTSVNDSVSSTADSAYGTVTGIASIANVSGVFYCSLWENGCYGSVDGGQSTNPGQAGIYQNVNLNGVEYVTCHYNHTGGGIFTLLVYNNSNVINILSSPWNTASCAVSTQGVQRVYPMINGNGVDYGTVYITDCSAMNIGYINTNLNSFYTSTTNWTCPAGIYSINFQSIGSGGTGGYGGLGANTFLSPIDVSFDLIGAFTELLTAVSESAPQLAGGMITEEEYTGLQDFRQVATYAADGWDIDTLTAGGVLTPEVIGGVMLTVGWLASVCDNGHHGGGGGGGGAGGLANGTVAVTPGTTYQIKIDNGYPGSTRMCYLNGTSLPTTVAYAGQNGGNGSNADPGYLSGIIPQTGIWNGMDGAAGAAGQGGSGGAQGQMGNTFSPGSGGLGGFGTTSIDGMGVFGTGGQGGRGGMYYPDRLYNPHLDTSSFNGQAMSKRKGDGGTFGHFSITYPLNNATASQPFASFTATPPGGTAPLTVQFNDTSTGNPTAWQWSFGDGTKSSVQNPSHTYTVPGIYSIVLTVSNSVGSDTSHGAFTVVVTTPTGTGNPGGVGFSADPLNGAAPLQVQFTDLSSNSPTSWLWNFGDGSTSTSKSPLHTYTAAGTYEVDLDAKTAGGDNWLNKTGLITVVNNTYNQNLPEAQFIANQTVGNSSLPVQFTDLSIGNVSSWSWDFGDGNTSTAQNPTHVYYTPGAYTVNLTATNSYGSNTKSKPGYINVNSNLVNSGATGAIYTAAVTLTNPTSTSGYQVMDTFSYSAFNSALNADFSNLNFTAGSSTGSTNLPFWIESYTNSSTANIWVALPPSVTTIYVHWGAITAGQSNGYTTFPDFFTDFSNLTGFSAVTGGGTATVSNHILTLTGASSPTQLLTSSTFGTNLAVRTRIKTAHTGNGGGFEYMLNSYYNGADGLFFAASRSDSGLAPCLFSYYNSAYTSLAVPWSASTWATTETQKTSTGATFLINDVSRGSITTNYDLRAGNLGFYADTSSSYQIQSNWLLVRKYSGAIGAVGGLNNTTSTGGTASVNFTASPVTGNSPLTVAFTDTSANATAWNWYFGDGSSSTSQNPSHVYANPGLYTVSLTATISGSQATTVKAGYINVTANAPSGQLPIPQFSGSPISGPSPLSVQFNDASQGVVNSWYWDFGDGNTSASSNPSHIYYTPGIYTVRLGVANQAGSVWNNKTGYITVSNSLPSIPQARFAGSPVSGLNPLIVTFNDLSIGQPTSWSWDFGDGQTSTQENPTHVYQTTGSYTVKLTATNTAGSTTSTLGNYINVFNYAPTCDFSASPLSGNNPLTVTFTDTSSVGQSNAPITSWFWDFGDGSTSTQQNPSHTYSNPGVYTVIHNATSTSGTGHAIKGNYITISNPPIANFIANPVTGGSPLSVNFTDMSSGSPGSWSWSFGDGGSSTAKNPVHTYTTPGLYTVTLTATNTYGSNTTTKPNYINVAATPIADFAYNPSAGNAPLAVIFSDLSTGNPTSWSWNFGDSNTSTQQNPGHTYVTPGTYSVTLTSTNTYGSNVKTKSNIISVSPAYGAVANFTGSPVTGTLPLTVTFTDHSINATSWSWDFGDSSTSTQQNPTHVYSAAGTYTVKLIASNAYGASTLIKSGYITVVGVGLPVVDFSGTPLTGVAPLVVTFTDHSTNATSWSWDFGDGQTSSVENPVHTYNIAGVYSVRLQASNTGGTTSYTRNNYITVTGTTAPQAQFIGSPLSGNPPLAVQFTDSSPGYPSSWNWDFGDGSSSSLQNPSHTYALTGSYSVSLTVTNGNGTNTLTRPNYISVNSAGAPVADFYGNPITGNSPLTVSFTDASKNSPTAWSWDFGDGSTDTSQNPTHTYSNDGTYTVTLTATNVLGSNTKVKNNYVIVGGNTIAPPPIPTPTPGPNGTNNTSPDIHIAVNTTLANIQPFAVPGAGLAAVIWFLTYIGGI